MSFWSATKTGQFKQLILKTQQYQELEKDFRDWLEALGYNPLVQKQQQSNVREFLYNMEEDGFFAIEQITAGAIERYYRYLQRRPNLKLGGGLSGSAISSHISAIRLLFTYVEETERLRNNPMSGLNFPRPVSKSGEFFTQQEITKLYATADGYRDRALLSAFYGCGLRRREAEKLNTKDIDYKAGLLYVREGKGRKRRVIPMSEKVKEDMENYFFYERVARYKEKSFFINRKGTSMRAQSFAEWFKKLKNKTGIEKSAGLHSLRHSIATHLLENGVRVEYVRDFLGHEFLETTQIYTKVSKKQLLQLTSNTRHT